MAAVRGLRDEIARLLEAGQGVKPTARQLGVTPAAVQYVRRQLEASVTVETNTMEMTLIVVQQEQIARWRTAAHTMRCLKCRTRLVPVYGWLECLHCGQTYTPQQEDY